MVEQPKALYNLSEFFTWRTAILKSDLPPLCKFTLLVLSCHMNEIGGSCFPSISVLSDESGMSKPTVIKEIRIAVERGWLEKGRAGFAGQKWRHNIYRAVIPENVVNGVNQLVDNSSEGGKRQSKGGKRHSEKVVNGVNTSTSVNSSNSSSTQKSLSENLKNLKNALSPSKT